MIGRSDLMDICQTSLLLVLTLACFPKNCRHFAAEEGVFPKTVPKTSCGNTRNNLASYLLGCAGVTCSEAEKWSVQYMCEITFAGVNLDSVFIYSVILY